MAARNPAKRATPGVETLGLTFEHLKADHRRLRDNFPEPVALRTHRALSWLQRAELETDDADAQFLFLWIAFNAAYAREIPAMGDAMLGAETFPARGWKNFEMAKDVIEGELGDGPYLFGDWFTAADVMIGSMFIYKRLLGGPPERPKLEAYVERLLTRPASMKLSG